MIIKNTSFMKKIISQVELKNVEEFEVLHDSYAQKLIEYKKEQNA
jgi:hypothetical protein